MSPKSNLTELRDLIRIVKLEKEKKRINEERFHKSVLNTKDFILKMESYDSKPTNSTLTDLIHTNELEKEKRRNEEKLEDQLGIKRSLKRFHKPVLEEIEKQDTTWKQQIHAIQNLVHNLSIIPQHESTKILEIEPDYSPDVANMFDRAKDIVRYYLNKHVDTNFIKNEGLELTIELIIKTKDELDKIINSEKERRKQYILLKANAAKHREKDVIKEANHKMKMMNEYIEVLALKKQSDKYIGLGLDDKLEVLGRSKTWRSVKISSSNFLTITILSLCILRIRESKKKYERYRQTESRQPDADGKRNRKNNKKFKLKCDYCGIFGHKASIYRKKKENKNLMLNNNKPFKNNSAMLAETNETKEKVTFNTVLSCVDSQRNIFCLDSGATSRMCFNEDLFTEINPIDDTYVKLAVDKTVKALAKATVTFDVLVGNQTKGITLQNVLYIPDLKNNLISISKLTANNFTVKFQRNHANVIHSKNKTVIIAKREKEFYYLTAIVESMSIVKEIEQRHQKFGHLNEKDLKKLQAQNIVYGMNFKPNDTLTDCKVCIQGKQTATPFSKEPKNRSSQLLSEKHSDLCGAMRVESIGKSFDFATFIDDCSRLVHVYFLRSKDEVKSAFLEFKAYIENKLNCKIKTLRTDQGLEYVGPNFDLYLVKNGIKRECTCAYTPQMNGIAEREPNFGQYGQMVTPSIWTPNEILGRSNKLCCVYRKSLSYSRITR
ncbi:Retrovirus-related Pol polyprotein from transposon TNT 1-94 [Araneus ventricosus]|uniref:Retrovirus-related Pol polyprotein from transposon TNT 1-94 n=1 Tax=Araneus ventricosus TaxID=182803 RepID=A0A4Y2J8J7_ARAVE|nr:Retrovirus-related Pol polyprotein from transposon TNT 1-94 [Araneus ventricosus]